MSKFRCGIRFEAIGAYIEKLEDDQNGTDFLARRLQVASQDASNATHADEDSVPAVIRLGNTAVRPVRATLHPHQKDNKILGKRTMAIGMEIMKTRFAL
jgi:hypothetical protein